MSDLRTSTQWIVIHCSDTPARMVNVDAKEIDRWHRERGFLKIGYHFVIKRDGTRERGRMLDEIGAHVIGYNNKSVGVCLVGGRADVGTDPEDNFTAEQWVTLHSTLIELKKQYPTAKIVGHRDMASQKQCPSFDVADWLKGFPELQ